MEQADPQLLNQFIANQDEQSFRILVERHTALVYAAAKRQVHDPAVAQDVAQAVFILLARKGASVDGARLAGWLLGTTRHVCMTAIRAANRRSKHEREAAAMRAQTDSNQATNDSDPAELWNEISSRVDQALSRLSQLDRTAIALRYLEDRPLRSVAEAMGTTEEATRKRVARAIQKLRDALLKETTSTYSVDAIGTALALSAADKTPPAVLSACHASLSAPNSAGSGLLLAKGAMHAMTILKLKSAAVIAAVVFLSICATVVVIQQTTRAQSAPASQPQSPVLKADQARTDDLLSITIGDLAAPGVDGVVTSRVDPEGMIVLPFLRNRLPVAGMTMVEVEQTIQQAYVGAHLLKQTQVKVSRLEIASNASIRSGPIAEGDTVRVIIIGLDAPGKLTTVEKEIINGSIALPRIGPVNLLGQTEAKALRTVTAAYRNANLIQDAGYEVLRIKAPQKP